MRANFHGAHALHPLRPGTGRRPGFGQHALKMRSYDRSFLSGLDYRTPSGYKPAPAMIHVTLIEDDRRTRESLRVLFDGTHGFSVAGVFATAEEALARLPRRANHIVLLDIELPGMSGIDSIPSLKERDGEVLILMLTAFEDTTRIFRSLTAGAHGYLLKRTPPAELIAAITDLANGGAPMTASIARKVIQHFHRQPAETEPTQTDLTEREQMVLRQLATSLTYKEIGAQLGISAETVRSHVKKVYEKLHVTGRAAAVVKHFGI